MVKVMTHILIFVVQVELEGPCIVAVDIVKFKWHLIWIASIEVLAVVVGIGLILLHLGSRFEDLLLSVVVVEEAGVVKVDLVQDELGHTQVAVVARGSRDDVSRLDDVGLEEVLELYLLIKRRELYLATATVVRLTHDLDLVIKLEVVIRLRLHFRRCILLLVFYHFLSAVHVVYQFVAGVGIGIGNTRSAGLQYE